VADPPRGPLPWLLVAASALLLVIVLFLFFGAYLPGRQQLARLEAELQAVYAREAQLQSQLEQHKKAQALREQQGTSLTAERDALTRRIEELEKELAAARAPRRR
jgi:septal ring factor EnvC (AmiA/AmiB activator)